MTISVRIEHIGGSKKLEIVGGTREGGGAHQHAVLEPGQSTTVAVYDWKTFAIRELDEAEQAVPDGERLKASDDTVSTPLGTDDPTEIPSDLAEPCSNPEAGEPGTADNGTEVTEAGEVVEQAEKAHEPDEAGPPRV